MWGWILYPPQYCRRRQEAGVFWLLSIASATTLIRRINPRLTYIHRSSYLTFSVHAMVAVCIRLRGVKTGFRSENEIVSQADVSPTAIIPCSRNWWPLDPPRPYDTIRYTNIYVPLKLTGGQLSLPHACISISVSNALAAAIANLRGFACNRIEEHGCEYSGRFMQCIAAYVNTDNSVINNKLIMSVLHSNCFYW